MSEYNQILEIYQEPYQKCQFKTTLYLDERLIMNTINYFQIYFKCSVPPFIIR